jgi:hypothetical protein
MLREVYFEWKGREYDHTPKSADWYWALGIVAAAAAIASVLFGNYLLAVLIIVATASLALHAAKVPPEHRFQLVEQGLIIGNEMHPFEKMISFSMLEDIEGTLPPLLSIKNKSWFSPHLVIPLEGVDADAMYIYFLQHVDENEHHHSFSDVVAVWLGF